MVFWLWRPRSAWLGVVGFDENLGSEVVFWFDVDHAHDQVHGILFHGSASCVHGKRCWRFPELVHLVKRRKKCSCDRWSVRLTRVTSWMSWESGPALKDFLAPPSFAPSCSPSSATWSKQRRWATPVPDVLRHLRHGIGWDSCLKQRVGLAVPRPEESYLSKKGDDPRTDQVTQGADSELPGWQPKEKEA